MPVSVNLNRLWHDLMTTAGFGASPGGGLTRLALTDSDREVRDWFRAAAREAGCAVTVDDMGNVFARRPGTRHDLPPILVGSHLDTQPEGGRFDGVLGVLAGLEAVRALNDAGIATAHPIEVVNWTNEEGSRFDGQAQGSAVFVGRVTRAAADDRRDAEGHRFGDELERIGYRGTESCGAHPIAGCLELHIEQGPALEARNRDVGVVTGVQGMRWFNVTLEGFAAHAGTTPMHLRRDAALGAARMVETVHEACRATASDAVATTGLVRTDPGSRNVVAGRARLTVDMRHPDDAVLDRLEGTLRERFGKICGELGLTFEMERAGQTPPVTFDPVAVEAVRAAAKAHGYAHDEMVSGAGHDAAQVAGITPTAMIFVPCRDGISHNEAESITQANAAAGANVLAEALCRLDNALANR